MVEGISLSLRLFLFQLKGLTYFLLFESESCVDFVVVPALNCYFPVASRRSILFEIPRSLKPEALFAFRIQFGSWNKTDAKIAFALFVVKIPL